MSITNTTVLTGKYLSREIRQENNEFSTDSQKRAGTLSDGKTVSDVARGTHVGGNAAAERDIVTISEEARNLWQNSENKENESGNPFDDALSPFFAQKTAEGESPANAASTTRERILKQIKEVKELLEDANQRLAEASAKPGTSPESSGKNSNLAAAMGLEGAVEAKAIQQEIGQLNQQLQLLYQQLQDQTNTGGGAPAMGTAGIGGSGTGEAGGLGERIFVA